MSALFDKRLLIVSGKGGVGKTTVSAALARSSALAGAKTLVCEVNADERITSLLGHAAVGPEVTRVEPNLWAVNVRPDEAMREYALMVLKFESVYNAVFENKYIRYFLRFIPSLQELVILGKILFHLQEKNPDGTWRFDRIIIDAPATGHAISFFSVPQVILDTVPPGPLARDAATMRDLLVDPKVTAAVLVTLPEEMPVNELIELHAAFRDRVKLRTEAVVLNAHVPERFSADELSTLEGASPALHAVARTQRNRAQQSAEARTRLERELGVPVATVARAFPAGQERPDLNVVRESLSGLLGRTA